MSPAKHNLSTNLNNWEIAYSVDGTGEPVLSIHGGFGGAAQAVSERGPRPIAEALTNFSLIDYDRRNCGNSEMREENYSQDDIADEAVALLAHLEIETAIICGDSMGGTIAQSLALRHPHRVKALALIETSAHMRDVSLYGPFHHYSELWKSDGMEACYQRRRESIYNPPPFGNVADNMPDQFKKFMAEMAEQTRKAIANADESIVRAAAAGEVCNWAAHSSFDTRENLQDLPLVPTIIIHGDADSVVPIEHGLELVDAIKHADSTIVSGGDHGILLWPEAKEALRNCVEKVST